MIPLYEVVDHIAGEPGIQFNMSPQIGDVQVSASIRSNDWQEAVSKLTKSYSRAGVSVWERIKTCIPLQIKRCPGTVCGLQFPLTLQGEMSILVVYPQICCKSLTYN
ncbi:MAG: hypothetical protein QF502_04760 [Nitrospinaceae bacterium]|nr:hypothetical protein [Nitrospinaceae bacterium]HAK38118.1 hypothetical protein [Nitrospina sp.]